MDEMNRENIAEEIKNENARSVANTEQNYEFITETIKKKPINKRKLFKKIVLTVVLAVVFGVISCVTFVYLYPVISEKIHPEDDTKIVKFEKADEEKGTEDAVADKVEEASIGKIEKEEVKDRVMFNMGSIANQLHGDKTDK